MNTHNTSYSVDDILDAIPKRLREVRRRSNLGQNEVAAACEVSSSTYKGYEVGHRVPGVAFLIRFASEMGVDPSWVILGDASTADIARAALVEMVAVTVARNALGERGDQADPDRIAKRARYAYEASVAKGTDFATEFQLILDL